MASDAHYRLYASSDLEDWSLIASKDGTGLWNSFFTAVVMEDAAVNGLVRITVGEDVGLGGPRFHRLEAAEP